jgi:aryl-alcohol dehydrogenase-like predicted oxidoreductase
VNEKTLAFLAREKGAHVKTTLTTAKLGHSGIEVTKMGIGLWAMGGDAWGPTEDQESLDTIAAALDAGITFFDTADVYGAGHSEELLGKAMQGQRQRFIVASKIGWMGFDGENNRTAYDTVDKLIAGVESNLRRLQTDYLDLIQSHINFRDPTMEVFIAGFQKLKEQGKVRAYGVSTSDFEYLRQFNDNGGCSALQIDYSILNRTPEADIFPYCLEHNIGVIVRGPLAMGILTGKFNAGTQFGQGDFRQRWQDNPEEHAVYLQDLAKVEQLKEMFPDRTLAQISLQFAMAHPAVSTVIPGAKNIRQLQENLSAALLPPLTEGELCLMEQVTPTGGGRKIWPA